MKFLFAVTALFSTVSALSELSASSSLGQQLLSKARNLEQNNEEFQYDWVADYSIKFQGCHHIKQWNDEADEDEDVKIETKRLIRFRLCPSDSCSSSKAAGCTSGYGDYVVDMDTFMEAYWEAKREEMEYNCEYHMNNNCNCEDDDDQDDNFDREYCEYECYLNAGMEECIENNPDGDEEVQQFDVDEYMECGQLQIENNNRRKLDENEVEYFVGPYCAEQGGAIHLGVFTDDACSIFSEVSFQSLAGYELPYSEESLVSEDCLSCMEMPDQDEDGNQNDQQDEDRVIETCERLYQGAGKCEVNLPSGTVYEKNNNGCNYMEGIRIVRSDGIIDLSTARPSPVATAFIVIFAMAFAAMAFYVWYLRNRLGVKHNTLL